MAKLNIEAKEAIKQVSVLIEEFNKLKTSMKNVSKSNKASIDKFSNDLNGLKTKVGEIANKLNYLEAVLKKNAAATNQATKAVNKLNKEKKKSVKNTSASTKAEKMENSAFKSKIPTLRQLTKFYKQKEAAQKKSAKASRAMNVSVLSLIKSFGVLAGIQGIFDIFTNVYDNIKTFDSLNFALEKITETSWAYNEAQKFMLELARDFGAELVPTTERWVKFAAAADQSGLTLKQTEDIFRSMTKASAVLGLQTDEMIQVYLALEQMLSKGKITTEELRRQLGERLPGAMGIMAASMGKTIPELDKMMKRGEVLSAEVLPNFAKAVESAFGIESVDKVNTLTAAQNRLGAAWQNLIRVISDGDSIIKKALAGMMASVTDFLDMIAFVFGGDEYRDMDAIMEMEKRWKASFKTMAQSVVNDGRKIETHIGLIRKELEKLGKQKQEALDAGDDASIIEGIVEKENFYSAKLTELNQKVEEQLRKYAKNNIAIAKDKRDQLKEIYDEMYIAYKGDPNTGAVDGDIINEGFIKLEELGIHAEKVEDVKIEYLNAAAAYNVLRKLVETPTSGEGLDPDPDGENMKKLRNIKDLTLEIIRAVQKSALNDIKIEIADPKTSNADRLKLIQEAAKREREIARLDYKIKERDAKDHYTNEIADLKAALEEGKVTRENYNQFILDAEKEKNQKLDIEFEKFNEKLASIEAQRRRDIEKVDDDVLDFDISQIEMPYNIEIAKIKETYRLSKKTTADKEQMERDLRRVSVDMTNAIIDAKIKAAEASIKGANADEEWVQRIIAQIAELRAAQQVFIEDDGDDFDDAWVRKWQFLLDVASQFSRAIGDIVDGMFQNRIENIGAEIEATREKYDKLIELADGHEAEQEVLRRNREEKIRELEKKRLKEEQKQFRARKAFAVADIAIKTAQAIMGIWAEFPKADFGISAGLATALVSALGAAQIAAVLAQPVPKFKDGGRVRSDGPGMINDNIWQEYVERDGNIMTTKRRNAVVDLKEGDIVYKNYDDMVRKSGLINSYTGGTAISEKDFNRYFMGIQGSIEKGFKKAKINNSIKVVNQQDNDNYAKSLRW